LALGINEMIIVENFYRYRIQFKRDDNEFK